MIRQDSTMTPLLSDSPQPSKRIMSLDVLIGGAGEKDTTVTSSFPIAECNELSFWICVVVISSFDRYLKSFTVAVCETESAAA
jgi:hypothetical protein